MKNGENYVEERNRSEKMKFQINVSVIIKSPKCLTSLGLYMDGQF